MTLESTNRLSTGPAGRAGPTGFVEPDSKGMSGANQFQVRVLTSLDEIERIRPTWVAMQWWPEADIDYYSFIVNVRPEVVRPLVILVSQGGEPLSLFAGRVEDGHLEIKLGYKLLWRAKVRRVVIPYGGFMGQNTADVSEVVVRQLLRSLREQDADMLVWGGIRWKSDLQRILERTPNLLCRDYLVRSSEHWTLNLPASLEDFIKERLGKRNRKWARQILRRIEEDFPGEVRYACFSAPNDVEELFKHVVRVAEKTYQWGLGVGFRGDEEHRKSLKLEAEKGWLRGYVLYVKNEPVAFWICVVYKDKVYGAFTGYDPAFREYDVGNVLFLWGLREMCEQKMKQLDFGLGTALYKEWFCDAKVDETTMCIFAFDCRGILLNVLRLLTQGPVELVRSLLARLGLDQKVKKLWRAYATPRLKANELLKPTE